MKLKKNAIQPLIAVAIVVVLVVAAIGVAWLVTRDNDDKGTNGTTNEDGTDDYTVRVGYLVGDLHQLSRVVMMQDKLLFDSGTLLDQYGVKTVAASAGGYANGPAVMTAFNAGEVDVAWQGAPPTILQAINSDSQVKIVATANNEGSGILVRDESITKFSQLAGKLVGTPGTGSIQHLWFLEMADDAGLTVSADDGVRGDTSKIYWTAVAPVNQAAQLQSGAIDAAIGWEPYVSGAEDANAGTVIEWSGEYWPNHPCCVLVASNSFIKNHAGLLEKIVRAHLDASEWIQQTVEDPNSNNYTKLVKAAKDFSGVASDEVVEGALEHTQFTYDITDALKTSLVGFTKSFRNLEQITDASWNSRGYASEEAFINYLVDTTFLTKAKSMDSKL